MVLDVIELSTGLQSLVYTENSAGELVHSSRGAIVCCDGSTKLWFVFCSKYIFTSQAWLSVSGVI